MTAESLIVGLFCMVSYGVGLLSMWLMMRRPK